jgi:WD40 repeat protein
MVAFSPDGRQLASAAEDGRIKLWDPATGQKISTLRDSDGAVFALAFSPDGRWLASAGTDKILSLRQSAADLARNVSQAGHCGQGPRGAMPDVPRCASNVRIDLTSAGRC